MNIKEKTLPNDLTVVFVEARSFPDGIQEAFDTLKSKVGELKSVSYFGISNPEPNKGIVYKAAASALPEVNADQLGMGKLTIKSGCYHSIQLSDIGKNVHQIAEAFQLILAQPDIDPQGACIEIYDHFNSDRVECIVRKNQ